MVCDLEVCNQIMQALPKGYSEIISGGVAGAAMATLGALVFLLFIAIYVYHAWVWMTIAKKRKYKKAWLAWIPFASTAMRFQLGKKFHWAWVFLYLIPIIGWIAIFILVIISHWKIFEMLKYPGWLSLAPIIDVIPGISGLGSIAYLVSIGFVAWKKR